MLAAQAGHAVALNPAINAMTMPRGECAAGSPADDDQDDVAAVTASALTLDRIQPAIAIDAVPPQYRAAPARRVVMLQLMPSAPPCFDYDAWVAYTLDAAEQDRPRSGPLTFLLGEPMFNRGFKFCADCTPLHAVQMDRQGRCKPEFFHRSPRRPASTGST